MGATGRGGSLAGVFRTLNDMRERRVVADYAIGGATAVLFYAEPTRTYDLDVFVLLSPDAAAAAPASLSGVYAWARARGFEQEREHLMVDGVPVQFLPAYNALVEEAGLSLPELALRFVLSDPAISCTLTGARSVAEVEANVAAAERGPLEDEILARIGEIAAMVPFRPFEEPFVMPFGRPYRGPGHANRMRRRER